MKHRRVHKRAVKRKDTPQQRIYDEAERLMHTERISSGQALDIVLNKAVNKKRISVATANWIWRERGEDN